MDWLLPVIGGGVNLNFKFRIVFWNVFSLEIGRFEKHIALSEKKPPLDRDNFYDRNSISRDAA